MRDQLCAPTPSGSLVALPDGGEGRASENGELNRGRRGVRTTWVDGNAAIMLAYLRSTAFLASALDALVGADAKPQALLASAPLAVMLAYAGSAAFLAPALLAAMLALAGRHSCWELF
jgi:hypothetical protein